MNIGKKFLSLWYNITNLIPWVYKRRTRIYYIKEDGSLFIKVSINDPRVLQIAKAARDAISNRAMGFLHQYTYAEIIALEITTVFRMHLANADAMEKMHLNVHHDPDDAKNVIVEFTPEYFNQGPLERPTAG